MTKWRFNWLNQIVTYSYLIMGNTCIYNVFLWFDSESDIEIEISSYLYEYIYFFPCIYFMYLPIILSTPTNLIDSTPE